MSDARIFADRIKGALTQWERLRNPVAGWVRVGLIATLPFLLWSNDLGLVVLWLVVALVHPSLIPVYVAAGEDAPLMTRMTDAVQEWFENTEPGDRLADVFPCAVLLLPTLWTLWTHILFWGLYFYFAAVISKGLFIYRLMQQQSKGDKHA